MIRSLQVPSDAFWSNKHISKLLIKKDTPFDRILACQSAFDNLKKIVTEAPILAHYKEGLRTIVKTDSSDYVSSGVFS